MPSTGKNSLKFLADRTAILMTVCIVDHGGNLSPWFREGFYSGDAGEAIRRMPEYQQSIQIIRNMVKREIARSGSRDLESANPSKDGGPTGTRGS